MEEGKTGTSSYLPREEKEGEEESTLQQQIEAAEQQNNDDNDDAGQGKEVRSIHDDNLQMKMKGEDVKDGSNSVEFAPLVLTGDKDQPVEALKDVSRGEEIAIGSTGESIVEGKENTFNDLSSTSQPVEEMEKREISPSETTEEHDANLGEDINTPPKEPTSEAFGAPVVEASSTDAAKASIASSKLIPETSNETAIPTEPPTSQPQGEEVKAQTSVSQPTTEASLLDLSTADGVTQSSAATTNLAEAVSAISANEAALALQEGLAKGTTSDALQETAEAMALPEQGTTNSEITSLFGEDTGDIEYMLGMNEMEDLKAIEEARKSSEDVIVAAEGKGASVDSTSELKASTEGIAERTVAANQVPSTSAVSTAPVNAPSGNDASVLATSDSGKDLATNEAPTSAAPGNEEAIKIGTVIPPTANGAVVTKGEAASSSEAKEGALKPTNTSPSAEAVKAVPGITLPTDGSNVSVTAASLPSAIAKPTPSVDEHVLRQIALVLKINKELIRLCVDLQAKELSTDVLFKDAALRLQSNLAFLASIADKSVKGSSSLKDPPSVTTLYDEPFPPTLHAPESQLPKLYQLLRSLGMSGKEEQSITTPTSAPIEVPLKTTTKRERNQSSEVKRKRQKDNDLHATPSPITASMMPPQQQRIHSPKGMSKGGYNAASAIMSTPPAQVTPPRTLLDGSNGVSSTAAAAMSNGTPNNPMQAQNLIQAFGPNAVNNLQALQTHYRGQQQAIVSYMEANIAGFRTLPIQTQLQHMTNVQNAAMQRQRQQSQGVAPQQQQQQSTPQQSPFQIQQAHLRRTSAAQSPGADSPGGFMTARKTQSPMPINAGSPGSTHQQLHQQQSLQQTGGRPITPSSSQTNIYGQMASPSSSSSMPSNPMMNTSLPSPQQSVAAASYALPSAAQSMMANVPVHLQQQFLQQLQHQQQQQQQYYQQQVQLQQQSNQQTSMQQQPQMGYNPSAAFSNPQMLSNGNMWTNPQQHQSPTG